MSKFKVGERARLRRIGGGYKHLNGRECTVTGPARSTENGYEYSVEIDGFDGRYAGFLYKEAAVFEIQLQKLLPSSDTYRPADISIDDLMRSVRGRVTA